ncbi:MAG: acyl-CoA thioesterase [Balneola sp.]|nr:MAG: acyl-CoA thioesterase [Balneola sp.]
MGYVYNGRYLEYFEAARTEMIRSYGLSYRNMEDEGIMLPVINAELEYKSPVFYDEEINIKVLLYEVPVARLVTYYKVVANERQKLCVEGKVVLCFMDEETRRPIRAPKFFLDSIPNFSK